MTSLRRMTIFAVASALAVALYFGLRTTALNHDAATPQESSLPVSRDPPSVEPPPAARAQLTPPAEETWSPRDREAMQLIHAKFATGDFIGALRLADEKALDHTLGTSFHAWLEEQMAALLVSAGWARLKLGDCEEALSFLRRAEAMKRTPETAKGLAVCHYKQKNYYAAREQLTWYLERQSNDRDMVLLQADVLESDGRYDEAVKLLEQLSAAPDIREYCAASEATAAGASEPTQPEPNEEQAKRLRGICARLTSMRARARESSFQQTEASRNFRLSFRGGEHEDLVSFVFTTLEDALDEFHERYGFRLPPAPIEVLLYPSSEFRNMVVGSPVWAEGIFDGRIRIPVPTAGDRATLLNVTDTLRIVLRHELVHALFAQLTDQRQIPPWFDEGTAQRLACIPQCPAFSFPATPGALLESTSFHAAFTSYGPLKAGRAYQQSLYLIQVLERDFGEDVLRSLIQAIGANTELSSDRLLAPAGLTFASLHQRAQKSWNHREIIHTPVTR